jgi:hypothetical protein
LDTKEAIIQDAMMDDEYVQLYKAVWKTENVDVKYSIR